MSNQLLFCPDCGQCTLRLIERIDSGGGEAKESRTCDACSNLVYLVRMDEEEECDCPHCQAMKMGVIVIQIRPVSPLDAADMSGYDPETN